MQLRIGLIALAAITAALVVTTALLITQTAYLLFFILLGTALVGAISASIMALTIAQRKIIRVGEKAYVAPDVWLENFDRFNESLKSTEEITLKAYRNLNSISEETSKSVSKNLETIQKLREKIDSQDAEIVRLRSGYDSSILKRALKPFVSVLNEAQNTDGSIPSNALVAALQDALEAAGATPFSPRIGEDIRTLEIPGSVDDRPIVEETSSLENDYRILDVQRPGFLIMSGEWPQVLSPAKVTIGRARNVE